MVQPGNGGAGIQLRFYDPRAQHQAKLEPASSEHGEERFQVQMQCWVSHSTALCLNVLACSMGMVTLPTCKPTVRIKVIKTMLGSG